MANQTQAQQLTEIVVTLARLEERVEQHYTNITARLDELKASDAQSQTQREETDRRLARVETDVTFAKRILAPLLAVSTALGTWLAEAAIKHP